jgi:hypothetical protein
MGRARLRAPARVRGLRSGDYGPDPNSVFLTLDLSPGTKQMAYARWYCTAMLETAVVFMLPPVLSSVQVLVAHHVHEFALTVAGSAAAAVLRPF